MNNQCTNKAFRVIAPKLLRNVSILYQNQEIDEAQKNRLTQLIQNALKDGDKSHLCKAFSGLRVGSLLPHVIEECIELTNN